MPANELPSRHKVCAACVVLLGRRTVGVSLVIGQFEIRIYWLKSSMKTSAEVEAVLKTQSAISHSLSLTMSNQRAHTNVNIPCIHSK